jgi:hypothetical protein
MFVCMHGTYTNPQFWTNLKQTLHTSPPWSARDRRVCMDLKFLISSNFWALFLWRPLQNHGHKIAAGATVFRDILLSVIPVGFRVTSPTLRYRGGRSHPRQSYIRDSSWCSRDVTDITLLRAAESSAAVLYPWFQLVFAWRHRHYVIAGGGVIRGTLISVILAGVPLTSRKWRCSRWQRHQPQRRIPYSGGCSRHVTDITFNRATGPSATALYPSF